MELKVTGWSLRTGSNDVDGCRGWNWAVILKKKYGSCTSISCTSITPTLLTLRYLASIVMEKKVNISFKRKSFICQFDKLTDLILVLEYELCLKTGTYKQ